MPENNSTVAKAVLQVEQRNHRKHRMSVTLLLPTLNEIDGLKALLPQVDRSLFDDILLVDGKSTDGTAEYALSQGLTVVTQLRKGLHRAILDVADKIDTDYVIEFSMDGNCEVKHLPALVKKIKEGYDLVIVSRYLPPAKSYDDDIITGFGNWFYSWLISFMGKSRITDALGIYRGYKRSMLNHPEFRFILQGPTLEPMVSAFANLKRMKITEIPGDEPARIGGERKMRIIYNGSVLTWMVIRCYLFKWGLLRLKGPSKRFLDSGASGTMLEPF